MKPQAGSNRIAVLAGIITLGLLTVFLRLGHLQVVQRGFLLGKARQQQIRTIDVKAKRGSITDRRGQILAESIKTEDIFLATRMLTNSDRRKLLRVAPSLLKIRPSSLQRQLASDKGVWLKRNTPMRQSKEMRSLKIAALSFFPNYKRVYPQGRMAAHVLGFADVDGKGREGVEAQYDKALAGMAGTKEIALDAKGRQLISEIDWHERPSDGASLRLTIDSRFQHLAERELEKAWMKYKAKAASMVVMDPHTGEILALANYPNFNPNQPGGFTPDERRNRAVADAYEPGSTFKSVTAALAMEEGVVTPETEIDCQRGKAEFLGRTVKDHDDHLGVIPFSEVIAHSSNIGIVDVAIRLGKEKLYEGILKYGFGDITGVDLPGESKGSFSALGNWSQVSLAAISFGQEISCNVLRTAATYATFANGGKVVVPHVLRSGEFPNGRSVDVLTTREGGKKILSNSVRKDLVKMLMAVVDHGSGTPVAFPGYNVAGKTGTSQKYDQARRRYTLHQNYASFAGFVPAEDPQLLAVVVIDEPRGLTLGGWVAGPVFRETMSAMVAMLDIPPQRNDGQVVAQNGVRQIPGAEKDPRRILTARQGSDIEWVRVPELDGLERSAAHDLLKDQGLRYQRLGNGPVVLSSFPVAGTRVRQHSQVRLRMGQPRLDPQLAKK